MKKIIITTAFLLVSSFALAQVRARQIKVEPIPQLTATDLQGSLSQIVDLSTVIQNQVTINNSKVGITTGQANEISANTLKIGLTDGSVTTARIADNAVTTAKILNGTILEADLAPAVVTKLNATGGGYVTLASSIVRIDSLAYSNFTPLQFLDSTKIFFILPDLPNGYSVGFNQSEINLDNQNSASFTITNTGFNPNYYSGFYYSISGAGRSPINGSGNIRDSIATVVNLNLSGFNDGTITLSTYLLNATGRGLDVTSTINKITAIPGTQIFTNRAGSADAPNSTDAGGWFSGNATVTASSVQARTGTHSLRVETNTASTTNFRSYFFSDTNGWTTGNTITVKGWIFAPTGSTNEILLNPNGILSRRTISFTPNVWTYFEYTTPVVTIAPTTNTRTLFFYTNNIIYIDDLEIIVNPN